MEIFCHHQTNSEACLILNYPLVLNDKMPDEELTGFCR